MNYYGTLLQAQSFSLPPYPLMSPPTTLTSAAFRRKMMRGQAKIDLFVLQRDQMLYEPLEYTGKLWEGRHSNFMVLWMLAHQSASHLIP